MRENVDLEMGVYLVYTPLAGSSFKKGKKI